MSQGQIVKRSWSKKSQISEHTDILDIWDSGSHIYERWPNGNECYWKVISRECSEDGFTERLEKMPQWKMPGQVIRREQIPLLQMSDFHFELGGWSVEQEVESAYIIVSEGDSSQAHRPQAHRPQAHRPQAHRHSQQAHRHSQQAHRHKHNGASLPRAPLSQLHSSRGQQAEQAHQPERA